VAKVIPFPSARSREPACANQTTFGEAVAVGGSHAVLKTQVQEYAPASEDSILDFLGGESLEEEHLLEALDQEDDDACRRVASLLALLSSTEVYPRQQIEMVGRVLFERVFDSSVSERRRRMFADVLAMGYAGSWVCRQLCVRLRFGDAIERELAATALGNAINVNAIPGLVEALDSDEQMAVRIAAAQSIGTLRDKRLAPILVRALRRKPSRKLRLELLRSLRGFCDVSTSWVFLSHLQLPDIEIQRIALGAFLYLSCPEGDGVARDFLRHEEPTLRVLALRILERCGLKKDAVRVRLLLNDPEPRVRRIAASTLEQLTQS
jgi:HEAT repeat protein